MYLLHKKEQGIHAITHTHTHTCRRDRVAIKRAMYRTICKSRLTSIEIHPILDCFASFVRQEYVGICIHTQIHIYIYIYDSYYLQLYRGTKHTYVYIYIYNRIIYNYIYIQKRRHASYYQIYVYIYIYSLHPL